MCGICGVYQNGKFNKEELEKTVKKMNESQARRGPDDEGIFIDKKNGLALGHRRLSILDLSEIGKQPMNYGDFLITFNGEIYNFLELKKDLEQKGYKFKTKTDTEVILALYAEYAEKSFTMLRGMFAFGLWDGKNRKLFLVKDRYGIKPLYYFSDAEKLVFASTVKAIAESGLVSVVKNPEAYIGFLLFGSAPLPLTTYKNIFAVPAGCYLVNEADGKQELIKYYEPLEFFKNKTQSFRNSAITRDSIRNLLEESINIHLISDAPLGVFLSGGLDSSAIAALAAKNRENSITTLSIIFDEPEFSEQKYQRLVAQKIGSDHREIKITQKDFYDSFDEIFKAMDQPSIDGVNTFFISKAVKEAGLKVILSGLGADEIFCGYSHFRRAELLRKIQQLPRFLKLPLKLGNLFGGKYFKLSYFADNDILNFYLGIRGLFSPQEIAKILDTNLSEVEEFIKNLIIGYKLQNTNFHPIDLLSYLELKFYLQNQLLKDTDFMSMYHSVEVRVPFLDHLLVEYLSNLLPEIKLSRDINKPLLVESVRDLLPLEIFSRSKMGFTFPFQKWLKEKGDFKNGGHWSRFWVKEVLKKF